MYNESSGTLKILILGLLEELESLVIDMYLAEFAIIPWYQASKKLIVEADGAS